MSTSTLLFTPNPIDRAILYIGLSPNLFDYKNLHGMSNKPLR